jgi:hypothetical protein
MSRLIRSDKVAHSQARTLLGRDKPMAAVRAFTRAFRAAGSVTACSRRFRSDSFSAHSVM